MKVAVGLRPTGQSMAFNVKKAAQVIAFFARERGGEIDFISVIKLAYLADREFMAKYDLPILNDDFVSMEHGPVGSTTYDYLKEKARWRRDIWDKYILRNRDKNLVLLAREMSEEEFDELSLAEEEVLKEISERYAGYDPFELVEHVHKICSEWEDVGKTSKPLSFERIFNAIGKKNSNELADRIYEHRRLEGSLAKAV